MGLPRNELIQFPSGRWGFVGSATPALAYVCEDGSEASPEQIEDARRFGPKLARVKTRTWETREAAEAARAELAPEGA